MKNKYILMVFASALLLGLVLGCTDSESSLDVPKEDQDVPAVLDTNAATTVKEDVVLATKPEMKLSDVEGFFNLAFDRQYSFRDNWEGMSNESSEYDYLYGILDKNYARHRYFSGPSLYATIIELNDSNLLDTNDRFKEFVDMTYNADKNFYVVICDQLTEQGETLCSTDAFKRPYYDDNIYSLHVFAAAHDASMNTQESVSADYFIVYCSPKYSLIVSPSVLGAESSTGLYGWTGALKYEDVRQNSIHQADKNELLMLPKIEKLVDSCLAFK